uniref:Uncharacterized protein n=1 Tax=Strongyloides stercoralis TaxID=6248 RepID=A0AAF5D8K0_STRER
MSSDNEDRRVKKLFNIPIECQKPNIGSLQMSTDLRSRLQNFLSEAEKTPMPENAENKKLIEFVENEPTEVDSSDDSSSDNDSCDDENDQKSSNNIVINLFIPKDNEKETPLVEEINDT